MFTISKKFYLVFAFAILVAALSLRFYKAFDIFPFDHDQSTQAEYAYNLLKNHKFSLVGQELSFKGFFLGPGHSLAETIPYAFCNLRPDCTPYFFSLIGFLSAVITFFIFKRIFTNQVALTASLIYLFSTEAIISEIGVTTNNLIIPTVTLSVWCLYQRFLKKKNFLVLGAFVLGFAVVNFNPIVFFLAVSYFICAFLGSRDFKTLFLSAAAFLANLIPLAIFNTRHENILISNFIIFLNENSRGQNFIERFFEITWRNILAYYSGFLFQNANNLFKFLTLILVLFGLYKLKKSQKGNFYLFFPLTLALYIIGFTIYRGHVPIYYFVPTIPIFLVIVGHSITTNKFLQIFLIAFIVLVNIKDLLNFQPEINYKYKKEAVSFVIHDSSDKTFKLYNDMPYGLNTGYSYLFKALGKGPKEDGELLYILDTQDKSEAYKLTYMDKTVQVQNFGKIFITSVK